jgi:UDP-glucose 4-epimerase
MIKRTISLIGGTGFIGSNLALHFANQGDLVEVYSRSRSYLGSDGTIDVQILNSQVIVWCASLVNPQSAEANPELAKREIEDWNRFILLLEARRSFKGNLIFLSSGGCVYTGKDDPFGEADLATGVNVYGKMKIQMENSLRKSGLSWQILRLANVYGRNQPHGRGQGVIAEWTWALASGASIQVFGDFESYRDYIHIDDVVTAINQVSYLDQFNETFNIGSGQRITLGYLFNLFTSTLEKQSIPKDPRKFDRTGYSLNIEKIVSRTGWFPKIPIDKGIMNVIKESYLE